jgi:hypothetical protein
MRCWSPFPNTSASNLVSSGVLPDPRPSLGHATPDGLGWSRTGCVGGRTRSITDLELRSRSISAMAVPSVLALKDGQRVDFWNVVSMPARSHVDLARVGSHAVDVRRQTPSVTSTRSLARRSSRARAARDELHASAPAFSSDRCGPPHSREKPRQATSLRLAPAMTRFALREVDSSPKSPSNRGARSPNPNEACCDAGLGSVRGPTAAQSTWQASLDRLEGERKAFSVTGT